MGSKINILGMDNTDINANISKNGLADKLIKGISKTINIQDIHINNEFAGIFIIQEHVLNSIIDSMKENGYDESQPVIIWKEENYLIDGHTRLKAAHVAGINKIPVIYCSFQSKNEVIDYIHRLQFHRRNIDDSILIKLIIETLPYYEKKYGNGSKADFIMKKFIGLSETKAKQAIIVVENAEQGDIIKILHNEATIRAIYNKISLNKVKNKKVTSDFFDDEDDNDIFWYSDNGCFYFKDYEKRQEKRMFTLPKFLNTQNIRDKILNILKEEIGN